MNRRLQHFLAAEQLTPTQFADILGIQKSRLSHILSGRNKPGFDFVEKFISKFPNVNIEWFINGTGKMYKQDLSKTSAPTPADSGNFSDTAENPETDDGLFSRNHENSADFDEAASVFPEHSMHESMGSSPIYSDYQKDRRDSDASRLNKNDVFEGISIPGRQNRSISRITVFYSDGSFEEFERRRK